MSLRVYNTLSQKKELFEPVRPGKVGMYVCGPTVYKPPHIGHLVGPVVFDAIKRYLAYKGYEVTLVVNVTDVDDKIIKEAADTSQTPQQVAERCTALYFDCLKSMGIDTIDRFPKASEHIGEMVQIIETLIQKGHAYASGGNVWFDVTSDNDYGKLSHRTTEEQESGGRSLEGEGKRHPADFALWKSAKPGEPTWPSPWGPGRPGWHIECSAMSIKYLGETFDMHGGGDDLKFPHHENELAQSECCTGKTFAKYWLHNGLTRVKTKAASGEWKMEKQSKSIGNVVDARQFLDEQGADLMRYLLLSTHYRRPIDFSDEVIASTKKGLAVFPRLFERIEILAGEKLADKTRDMAQLAPTVAETELGAFANAVIAHQRKYLEMMDDDFNTAGAIAAMHDLAGEINSFIEARHVEQKKELQLVSAATAATATLRKLGTVLGLFRAGVAAPKAAAKDDLSDKLMQLLIKLRQQARKEKNFAIADGIRTGLTEIGITLEDRADGTIWRKA
ncbi:MAG: cysteine--tRNA ligase [Tepidisphaerales bacterium]